MVRFSSSFLTTTAALGLTASSLTMMPHGVNAASLTPPPKSMYPPPSMASFSGPSKATAPVEGDDSFNTQLLFNNLNKAWTKLQIDASATMFGLTRNILDSSGIIMTTDFTIAIKDQLQQTIYVSAQTSSDLLHAVLAPTLQPAPTPSPLDLRVVIESVHWPITTYLIAKMIDPVYNEYATHAYVDPCNLSQYDLGWFYGHFLADQFLQSSYAPVCLPRTTDTSVNFWYAPRQFISNIMTNDHEQEFYETFLPMTDLQTATNQFGADQLDSILQWLYNDLPTVVMHWLFNNIEFTKQRLIQYGWPLLMTLSEYCFKIATATYQVMMESFGMARDGLIAFIRNGFRNLYEFRCIVITILEKVWDRTDMFLRRGNTTTHMFLRRRNTTTTMETLKRIREIWDEHEVMRTSGHGYGIDTTTAAAVNGGGGNNNGGSNPPMSPQDRMETNIKQVLDAVEKGGWYVHYRILGIDNWTVNPDQIKNAYLKRTLWVHPNWNTAHGTHEAMRAVNASYKALQSGIFAAFVVAILGAALVGVVCYKQKRQKVNLRKTAVWFENCHGQQAAVVKEVLDAKYGRGTVFEKHCRVLGTRRAATPAEVKKAFHKRSLQVHPDKNNAPDAGKAFRAVKAANIICADYATHRTMTADVQIMIEIVVVQAMWMVKDAYNVCTHRAGTANAPTVMHCVIASLAAAIAGTVTGYILVNYVSK
jgi:DnaJ domain